MNEIILELYKELLENKIGRTQFIEKFFTETGINLTEEFCLLKINDAIIRQDADTIDLFWGVGFMVGFSTKSFPTLCKLLKSDIHHEHENIASFLQHVKDATTVNCLYEAAEIEFPYLDYDDSHQFGRKCIKALAAIGDENAISKLKNLSNSKIEDISEYAKRELSYNA